MTIDLSSSINDFKDFCNSWAITLSLSTLKYPQSNGQAKSSNKTIFNNLKKRLEVAKERWVEKLLGVLLEYRTTLRTATRDYPFSLVYGVEAIIPIRIEMPTLRTTNLEEEN